MKSKALTEFLKDVKIKPGHVGKEWVTSTEASSILNTSPDRINYYGKKGYIIRKRPAKGNFWLYSKKYISEIVKVWWKKYNIK